MKKTFVRLVIGLILLNAAIAVFVLLSGDIGDTEGKILGTSLLATASAVLAMTCAPALSRGRVWVVPHLGMASSVIGFVLVTIAIWAEIEELWLGKAAGSAFVVAAAAALACLLSAWPISGRASWVGAAANLLVAAVAAAILAGMWLEIDVSGYWRVFAVLAVLLAAASLAVPVLHRGGPERASEPIGHCPFCGADIAGTSGRSVTCPTCGRTYTVDLH
jgi:hypothetical protein